MNTLRIRFGAGLLPILLVAACAAPPSEPEQAPAPPEQQLLEVPELEPPPPLDEELDAPAPEQRAASGRTPRTGVLPGVEQRQADEVPFEQRLQERRKRVELGLDRPQTEQDPVDNVLDVEF